MKRRYRISKVELECMRFTVDEVLDAAGFDLSKGRVRWYDFEAETWVYEQDVPDA